ncbi:response regulator transcription factor [Paenibacillus sedimenti]|uniref:Response regulator transcription factor n=1 Tax=Paenibacillus sedimenti TaxID=2770274 RepID=A0A926KPG3_9BACL|nr:response regulator transcription factor [Paenibacillus sedimenti]MBD0379943.1 response regulator transcription factor [Paenibacillus sedimenti]
MDKIRVLLVEDDPFWIENISRELRVEADIAWAGTASTREEAVQVVAQEAIDVVLMDINLTENRLDGIEAAQDIRREFGDRIPIIMLTSLKEKDVVMTSFKSGAVNYITKASYPDIVEAIRAAHRGRASIHPDAAAIMRQEVKLMDLSPSEREIYELKRQGYNKTQISERLHKSLNTVKTQLRSIRNKLFP